MPINKMISMAKYGYLLISALMCIFGIVLITNPEYSIALLCKLGGWILILFGCVKLVGYYSKDLYRLAFQYDLASGILLIALGIIILRHSSGTASFICALLGLCILADAMFKIQISLDSRKFGIGRWYWILAAAIATGIFGFLLIFRKALSIRLLGFSLVAEGILNCITILVAVKIIRNTHFPESDDF